MRILLISAKLSFNMSKRYPINLLFSIVSSVFSFIPYIFIVNMFSDTPTDYIAYIIVGSAIWLVLSQLVWSIGLSTKSEIKEGTLEQLIISPANEIMVLAGKAIPSVIISFLTAIVVLFVFAICLGIRLYKIVEIIVLLISCIPMFVGGAILISVLVIKFKEVAAFFQVLMTCITVLFGITYPVQYLPYPLRMVSRVLVVPDLIQFARDIFIDDRSLLEIEILKNVLLMCVSGIVIFFISLFVVKRAIKSMKTKGNFLYV